MRVEDGVVVLERRNCTCQDGTVPNYVDTLCPDCKGTGKNPQDRRKYCRKCRHYSGAYGYIKALDPEQPTRTCGLCDGKYENALAETFTDYTNLHLTLPWRVIRNEQRQQSWGEQHIGLGLGSCVDYGRHKQQTDEELIAHEMKQHKTTQVCKIVRSRENMELCDEILIVTADGGYSVLPYWRD